MTSAEAVVSLAPSLSASNVTREAKKITNIETWDRLDEAPGSVISDISVVQTGDAVVVHGNGTYRRAVVTTADHPTAEFSTEESWDLAEARYLECHADFVRCEDLATEAGQQAGEQWDEVMAEAGGISEAWGSRSDYMTAVATRTAARVTEAMRAVQNEGVVGLVETTTVSVAPGDSKLIATHT